MKYATPVSILFLACSLADFALSKTPVAACLAIAAAVLYGFICYLERNRSDEIADLRREFNEVKVIASNVAIKMGWDG